jgi:tetratricopeptide (TPR) repeat protein
VSRESGIGGRGSRVTGRRSPWARLVFAALLTLACANDSAAWARQGDDAARLRQAIEAYRTGKYSEAIKLYGDLAAKPTATVAAKRGLVRALAEVGRYDEAETAARRFVGAAADGAQLQSTLGSVLVARGKRGDAETAFRAAVAAPASDSLTARLALAELRFARGDRAAAMKEFDHFIDVYNQRRRTLTSEELTAVGKACAYLGADDPALFKDAVKAYDAAIAADSTNLEPRLLEGELFLDKYNGADAKRALDELLRINPNHPRGLIAAARRVYFDGQGSAQPLAKRSVDANPNGAGAHAFLAALLMDVEDYPGATAEAQRALNTDSTSSDALAVLAAARYLLGDKAGFESAKRRALANNPHDAGFYVQLAEVSARNRLYREAAEFAREGTLADSTSWHALGVLGMNQLRLGVIDSGRTNLERAFARDPYDVWIKNTLDLLDTYKDYKEIQTPRFRFVVEKKDADLLALYFGPLAEEAYDKLAVRYGYKPPTPLRVEVYRSHADFSVRTVGLAGLGALGVSFGNTVAMDSPAARDAGEFNWGSTLWHELTHDFTLGASDNRVPRWLSEGLSVYEERRARPAWGADVTPDFLAAYKAGRLVPVSRMNDGFMHPAYPQQVIFSYYQASLVCEMVERDAGAKALPEMLSGYKSGLTTTQVFERVLKTDAAALDKRFDAYMQERFGARLQAIVPGKAPDSVSAPRDEGQFSSTMRQAVTLYSGGRHDEAAPMFERAKALFPEYSSAQSPYWFLAQIKREKGDLRGAANELSTLTARAESDYKANVELADLLAQLGDSAGAGAALDRAMYVSPFDPALHLRLAVLSSRVGDRQRAIRERRAVVDLSPVDRAEAQYQLALAYFEAGDVGAARREVLRALEEAPNFDKAQQLLLKLQPGAHPAPQRRGTP